MELDISEEQRAKLYTFLEEKEEIVRHGEMKDSQFESLAELGFGNGGVVMKVRHKPSGTVMARKVLLPWKLSTTIVKTTSLYNSSVNTLALKTTRASGRNIGESCFPLIWSLENPLVP